jgi:transcriptional regulator with XRE-family HTH domain
MEYMDFWDRLKYKMKDLDLTHEEVARKLGIPFGTFKNWLLRQTYPDAREAADIAKLLHTTVEYLVNGAEESVKPADDEQRLLDGYRRLSKYDKGQIMIIVDAWNRKYTDK